MLSLPTASLGRCAAAAAAAVLAICGGPVGAQPARAEPAATAHFASGTVTGTLADGSRLTVKRGTRLDAGATVLTGVDGRVHLSFTDGGYVALAPNSGLRIAAYRFSGRPDGNERIVLQLLKGGLRTVTGVIGKAMHSAYEMATRVATIGIRGTEYTLLYPPEGGVTGSVARGRIEVCNGGGCLEVSAGRSFVVTDGNTRPVLSDKAAELGAPPAAQPGTRLRGTQGVPAIAGELVDLSFQTVKALSDIQIPPDDPDGDSGERHRGIGYQLIGIMAPEVDAPVAGRVPEFLHQGNHPGNGWGAGGNPSAGPGK